MIIRSIFAALVVLLTTVAKAQDTFSIVAVDTITGEVGSAGASCVDLFAIGAIGNDFIGDLFPGVGAIVSQAEYHPPNQANARTRMLAGDTPAQIIAWLQANDAESDTSASSRQYGVVRLIGTGAQSAAHTGTACLTYAGQRLGANYSIQGNILLGPQILDQMEANFLSTSGTLAHKLMAALQGANVVGADSRCAVNHTSSLFAFLKVSAPGDPEGVPYISVSVRMHDNTAIEPIDSLQKLFNASVGVDEPPACECTGLGAEGLHAPDTIFHVRAGFDVAYCGRIDSSVTPFVYSGFTMWTCGRVRDSLEASGGSQGYHLSVSRSLFIMEGLALLPTGADMHLERRPCWRTEHRLFVAEDSSAFAIAGPITEMIAHFEKPTPGQVAQVQARMDAIRPSAYWMDQELLGQVFLCALYDAEWASRYRELREKYRWGGANAELYDEFLRILHDRRK